MTAGQPGSEDLKDGEHGRKCSSVTQDTELHLCKGNATAPELYTQVISALPACSRRSHSPGSRATGFCLLTLQGSFLCSRHVTRYGLDTARPGDWKTNHDIYLIFLIVSNISALV